MAIPFRPLMRPVSPLAQSSTSMPCAATFDELLAADRAVKARTRRIPADRRSVAALALAAVVIGYAFLVGLRPVVGDDLFFLLNDARWFVEHGEVAWTDHFSFTAEGLAASRFLDCRGRRKMT